MNMFQLENVARKLSSIGLEPRILKQGEFNDEPRLFSYIADLKIDKELKKKYAVGGKLIGDNGSGYSLLNVNQALVKCLFEAVERFCLKTHDPLRLKSASYKSNPKLFLNPSYFSSNHEVRNKKLKWIEGRSLTDGTKRYLPAQVTYVGYKFKHKEFLLDYPDISTGGAAHTSELKALINGLYEVIERDAFMNFYLGKITPEKVNLELINNKTLASIVAQCKKYKLELYVVNVTTDINIPTYASIIIDRTALGPAVSIGVKAGLRLVDVIVGSISEAFMLRFSSRIKAKNGQLFDEARKKNDVFAQRMAIWFSPTELGKIDFLISGPYTKKKLTNPNIKTPLLELKEILRRVKKAHLSAYYVDLSLEELKKIGIFVVRVVIPGLQPLYLREDEKLRCFNEERLRKVLGFTGEKYKGVNPIPHPFV